MSNRRTGKIARLPKATRDVVNAMIRDGRTYAAIIAEIPDAGLNEQNLTNWKEGGYQDWLKEQERLDDMRAKREFAVDIVRQGDGAMMAKAAQELAASQVYEALSEFNAESLKTLLREKPENFAQLFQAVVKANKGNLDREKFEFDAAAAALEKLPELTEIAQTPGIEEGEKLERVRLALFGVAPK